MPVPPVSQKLRQGQFQQSPIRALLKLADPRNIVAMGLDPENVISFAGGWVNHRSPDGLRDEYRSLAEDADLFHELGAYSPSRGLGKLREQLLAVDQRFYGTKGLSDEHLLVGGSSTQLTHTLFTTLLDPGDRVLLFNPSYANYGPQLALGPDGVEIRWLPVFDADEWTFLGNPERFLAHLEETLEKERPKLMLFATPDNPTSQIVKDDIFFQILEMAERANCFVVVDYAYRAQCFLDSGRKSLAASPADFPGLIRLHSNSKWCRGLGRRLGWIEADPSVVEAVELVQQGTTLCPDTVHQYALASYLEKALGDGSLSTYLDQVNQDYKKAGAHTVKCVRKYLEMPCLDPEGGLYTVVDVGMDGDEFVRDVLKATGVIFVPGAGFGSSLKNGIRISYGPLVHDLDRIEEGFRRVREYLG